MLSHTAAFAITSFHVLQWQDLQTKVRNVLGRTWTERTLKACVLNFWSRDKLIGHKKADICDPRYTALLNYAKQHLPDHPEVKVYRSNAIKQLFTHYSVGKLEKFASKM